MALAVFLQEGKSPFKQECKKLNLANYTKSKFYQVFRKQLNFNFFNY